MDAVSAFLDRLARASGAAAAASLAAIAVIIAAQIVARLFGQQIPAADDFAGWAMAASAFLALPYALRKGDHIRVTLIAQMLPKRWQHGLDLLATAVGVALACWGAWYAVNFVLDSWRYHEVAQGMLAVPLWIPQLSMAIGMTLFALMMLDRLLRVALGLPLSERVDGEASRTE
jgi:TRAP-type C4-dicarboxylate transport system permease small subunit